MFAGRRGDGSLLTGGGRLAGIDVADNDHVDVHLFLTADTRDVSQESIKIIDVDSPHGCGIEFSSVLCGILVFLREEVESDDKDVSNDECNGVFDDILTAQSDCLNQGMCRRGSNFCKIVREEKALYSWISRLSEKF
jgi:hypothetical protein